MKKKKIIEKEKKKKRNKWKENDNVLRHNMLVPFPFNFQGHEFLKFGYSFVEDTFVMGLDRLNLF